MNKNLITYFNEINTNASNISITNINGIEIDENLAYQDIYKKLNTLQETSGVLHFIGNGASASIASHFGLDYFKAGEIRTNTFNDFSALTAYGNDISFDEVFAFPISRILKEKDMLVAVSSSGNSPNIVRGLEAAKEQGSFLLTLSGMKSDNKIRKMGNINMFFPEMDYGPTECAHTIMLHHILDTFVARNRS
ncbi:SIS domain-containing protein [Gammaproteobacteria bacterium]|nr:SIS domain-containing protein [Gammaproteobacteria bacterium]